MSERQLKGVMIGAGFFGEFQAEGWGRIPAVHLAAVADSVPGRAEAFAARHGIARSYTDAREMLAAEKPDFADIVTRPDSHVELTRIAAQCCPAVICQKPMASTWNECRQMVEDCARAGARLLIHENWRWQPWYREIKRLLEAGRLGRVFQVGFRMRTGDGRGPEPYQIQPYFRAMERLLLYETVVHFLDTFRFLAGEMSTVFCQTQRINPVIRGEDCALVQVSFARGAKGLIDANRISGAFPPEIAFGELRIEGERAMARVAPDGNIFVTEYGQPEAVHSFTLSNQALSKQGYRGDSVKALQEHCAECLLTGAQAESEGADYLRTAEAVYACYRSAETGQPVGLAK